MSQDDNLFDDSPPEGGAGTLEVAAWHLQVLLTSLAGTDGKIMFLTALNVAGVSALIGVAITSEPSPWLLGVGLAISSLCVALGLARLWAADVEQFPTPQDALRFALQARRDPNAIAWRHFLAIQLAADQANEALHRRRSLFRALLVATPLALAVVVATALTTSR